MEKDFDFKSIDLSQITDPGVRRKMVALYQQQVRAEVRRACSVCGSSNSRDARCRCRICDAFRLAVLRLARRAGIREKVFSVHHRRGVARTLSAKYRILYEKLYARSGTVYIDFKFAEEYFRLQSRDEIRLLFDPSNILLFTSRVDLSTHQSLSRRFGTEMVRQFEAWRKQMLKKQNNGRGK